MSRDRSSGRQGRDGVAEARAAERQAIALRLREVRRAVFGESGVPIVAAMMGVSDSIWADYESGAVIPAEVILRFIDEVGVTAHWLLTGQGDKYRTARWFSLPHNRN